MIATRPFLILRMEITYLADERSLKFDFTTFVHVACHGGLTRWRTVSTAMQKDVAAPVHFFNMPRRARPSLLPLSFRSPTADAFFPSPPPPPAPIPRSQRDGDRIW
jgi:hypothetical protein